MKTNMKTTTSRRPRICRMPLYGGMDESDILLARRALDKRAGRKPTRVETKTTTTTTVVVVSEVKFYGEPPPVKSSPLAGADAVVTRHGITHCVREGAVEVVEGGCDD